MIKSIFKRINERKFKKMNDFSIKRERRDEIERIVDEKIAQYDLLEPRFDLIKFLKEKENFEIVLQNMPDDTTGLIIINDNDKIGGTEFNKLIAVNIKLQRDPNYIQRRRFIIAHEYAHSQLHKSNSILFAHRDTRKKDTEAEQEADFFARCLLMPRKLMDEVMRSDTFNKYNDSGKITYISQMFNVTEKKARQRLKEINSNA